MLPQTAAATTTTTTATATMTTTTTTTTATATATAAATTTTTATNTASNISRKRLISCSLSFAPCVQYKACIGTWRRALGCNKLDGH